MSNESKSPPRRPDFELEFGRASFWDNRKDGGHINFQMSGRLKDVPERIQEAKDNARDDNRRDERRSDTNRSGREDRQPRDNAPRYER